MGKGKDAAYNIAKTCEYGLQLLNTLEFMHGKNIIYNTPLTPSTIYTEASNRFVYLQDFTRARFYMVESDARGTLTHISSTEDAYTDVALDALPSVLDEPFASDFAKLGLTQSRKDDLESLLYTMVHLAGVNVGRLRKKEGAFETFLAETPRLGVLHKFYRDVSRLQFTEKPDYETLRIYLQDGMVRG